MGDVETPRPDLPFQGPVDTADDRVASALGRRLAPWVVGSALVVTVALVLWVALAPTAVEGELVDASFDVPGELVLGPDGDGCLTVVDGRGDSTETCAAELASSGEEGGEDVWFTADGDVVVGRFGRATPTWHLVDLPSGDVTTSRTTEPPVGRPERASELQGDVGTDGDRVVRFRTDGPMEHDADEDVLLDLAGPPGYRLRGAVASPDGAWVAAATPRGEVVVAPTDGSAPPTRWGTVADDGWVDLWSRVRWTDG